MKAKELLASRDRWVQDDWAIDREHESVDPTSPNACCWCMLGAIVNCYPDYLDQRKAVKKVEELLEAKGFEAASIPDFNDDPNTTHELVLSILEEADV